MGVSTSVMPYSERDIDLHVDRFLKKSMKAASDIIDQWQIIRDFRVARAKGALQVVIEMRQVNEIEGGLIPFLDPARGGGDPAHDELDACHGAPEGPERKVAEVLLISGRSANGRGVDVEYFAAIGGIERDAA